LETGEKHEDTEFHRIVAWDKLAETCHQYLRKGRKVYLEGRLQSHTYTGQDGIEQTGVEVVLENRCLWTVCPKTLRKRYMAALCSTSTTPATKRREPEMIESTPLYHAC
jgi:single stranded DNA-binding protein